MENNNSLRFQTFYVRGMHCKSCEMLIEREIKILPHVSKVHASAQQGEVVVEYTKTPPHLSKLNEIFNKYGYVFSSEQKNSASMGAEYKILMVFIAFVLVLGFIFVSQSPIFSLIQVNATSSLIAFFIFGLLASISNCASLVGGLILSFSKQWSTMGKFKPHVMFQIGRILSFIILGGFLGSIGQALHVSLIINSVIILLVSLIMIALGLQMLGFAFFNRFQLALPKNITNRFIDKNNKLPLAIGILTFFLPCGFTLTAQGAALVSRNPIQGALIMLSFVLGTAPVLFLIGISSSELFKNHNLSMTFTKIAGILVLFFAIMNINSQFTVLGLPSVNSTVLTQKQNQVVEENKANGLAKIVNGKQVLQMNASSQGYDPDNFKVKAGIPVRWEITDTGTSGCTNAVIARGLFEGSIQLSQGTTSIKEFTPEKPGSYRFSCWMGMITGTIQVIP